MILQRAVELGQIVVRNCRTTIQARELISAAIDVARRSGSTQDARGATWSWIRRERPVHVAFVARLIAALLRQCENCFFVSVENAAGGSMRRARCRRHRSVVDAVVVGIEAVVAAHRTFDSYPVPDAERAVLHDPKQRRRGRIAQRSAGGDCAISVWLANKR